MSDRDPSLSGDLPKFALRIVPRSEITRVHLVRHGVVSDEWRDRVYGQLDAPLSEKGQAQAEALSLRMADTRLDAIYASDLTRALDTARAIARRHNLEARAVPAFREASFGHWQGRRWIDILSDDADEVRAIYADFGGAKMKDGESLAELGQRVMPALRDIVERHRGESVAIASHGGVIRVILADALRMELSASARIEQFNCSMNVLDYGPEGVRVRLVNG